ncbi:MAG: putative 2OG-Fe(II) oxygenase [Alphaproteobacteria bacterium]|nr:putative 2OG-Fe(II) oxygenase [Alphaproteobacteria bacterium]
MFVGHWASPQRVAEVRDLILAKEDEIKTQFDPVPISGITDGLTSRWHAFNVFTWPEPAMREMADFVTRAYWEYLDHLKIDRQRDYIQGWANVLRESEKLTPHAHDLTERSYLSGNLCLSAEHTETKYYPPYVYGAELKVDQTLDLKNQPGNLVLFPSSVFHETSPNRTGRPRVTIGFDVFLDDADSQGRSAGDGRHILFDDPQGSDRMRA